MDKTHTHTQTKRDEEKEGVWRGALYLDLNLTPHEPNNMDNTHTHKKKMKRKKGYGGVPFESLGFGGGRHLKKILVWSLGAR